MKRRRKIKFLFCINADKYREFKEVYVLKSGKVARAFQEYLIGNDIKHWIGFPIIRL